MTIPRDDDHLSELLGLSVEVALIMKEAEVEAAKERHPSGRTITDVALDGVTASGAIVLTAADRCDNDCSAAAAYRVAIKDRPKFVLDFCMHHWRKHFPSMVDWGWAVVGGNPELLDVLNGSQNRSKGADHA